MNTSDNKNLQAVVILTGPTAVGKSALALSLAQHFQGEIVSADSRQVYIGLDIATAKPSAAEMALVPHHLIDVVSPDQDFTLPQFQKRAYSAIAQIGARHHLALVVGGTVLYLNALTEGWQIPQVAPDLALRNKLEQAARERGSEALYADLTALDPQAAAHISPNNTRRIVRALEVYHSTGQLFSTAQGKTPPPYRFLKLGLTLPREALYARADARIEAMLERGLIAEVERLLAAGYTSALPGMSGLGYSQISAYLKGELTLAQAVEQMKFATHRYIRQQYSWFRRDPSIEWFDASDPALKEKAINTITTFSGNS